MNLNPIRANMTELELDGMKVLFSYKTPVAALIREETADGVSVWHQYRTEHIWSNTTTRHINAWKPLGGAYGIKPQDFFDSLVAGVK